LTKTQWTERLKAWRHDNLENYAKTILSPPEKVSLYKVVPFPGVILDMGDRRMGKSGLAHKIAEEVHKHRGSPAVMHLPGIPEKLRKRLQKLLPDWFTVVSSRAQWPNDAVVIYDEAAQTAHARRTQSGQAVELDDLIGISGQRNQLIIFISHHSRKLDVNVITEVNRIIWKKPTYAHQLFERDEVSDFTMRAYRFFDEMRNNRPWTPTTLLRAKKVNLVLDLDTFAFRQCTNGLPAWWSEELSTLFREMQRTARGTVFQP
jgi:hypothetical protein